MILSPYPLPDYPVADFLIFGSIVYESSSEHHRIVCNIQQC
nr:MAG TPA: hypothetical protein [Caudoviricetes sp.]